MSTVAAAKQSEDHTGRVLV